MVVGIVWAIAGVFILLCLVGVLICVIKFVRARARLRLIEETPYSRVEELQHGVSKVKGHVAAQRPLLQSPMSGQPCVYFHFLVEEQRTRTTRNGNHTSTTTYWAKVIDDEQAIPVALGDETGQVGLDLGNAEVVLNDAEHRSSGTFNSAPKRLERALNDRYGRSSKGWIFNKTMRYTESLLEDGAWVTVVGDVQGGRSGSLRFSAGDNPLIVSDKSGKNLLRHFRNRSRNYKIGFIVLSILAGCLLLGATVLSVALPKSPHDELLDQAQQVAQQLQQQVQQFEGNPFGQPDPFQNPQPNPGEQKKKKKQQPNPVPEFKPGDPRLLPPITFDAQWAGKTRVNLIPLIDPKLDAVEGRWQVENNVLRCPHGDFVPRIQIPYRPPAEYDFVATFSQPALRNGVCLIMPRPQGGSFFWYAASGGGSEYGFWSNPNKGGSIPGLFKPNQTYTTVVQVRSNGVKGYIDGRDCV